MIGDYVPGRQDRSGRRVGGCCPLSISSSSSSSSFFLLLFLFFFFFFQVPAPRLMNVKSVTSSSRLRSLFLLFLITSASLVTDVGILILANPSPPPPIRPPGHPVTRPPALFRMKSESGWGGATAAVSPLRSRNCVETESFDSFLSSTGSDGRREEGRDRGRGRETLPRLYSSLEHSGTL